MPTVFEVVRRLMPFGSNPTTEVIRAGAAVALPPGDEPRDVRSEWTVLPNWPPDVFAAAATLINTAGCYSNTRYFGGHPDPAGLFFTPALLTRVRREGQKWADPPPPDGDPAGPRADWEKWLFVRSHLSGCWLNLVIGYGDDPIEQRGDGRPRWWDEALYLMVAADEASAGFGFISRPGSGGAQKLEYVLYQQYARYSRIRRARGFGRDHVHLDFRGYVAALLDPAPVAVDGFSDPIPPFLPYTPFSQCRAVTAAEACVQPKTQTPQVGCTIHALSNHTALLPPLTEVRSKWMFALEPEEFTERDTAVEELNLLVVPFPYALGADALVAGHPCSPQSVNNPARFFTLDQTWLRADPAAPAVVSPAEFADRFLVPLVAEAERESGGKRVHGLILPELALRRDMIRPLAERLSVTTRLEVLIAGALDPAAGGGAARNMVYGVLFDKSGGPERYDDAEWQQSKHHRWRIDAGQLRTYGFEQPAGGGPGLPPGHDWWEGIDVSGRECSFWVFRPGASVATLICEDLARIEPVQRVVRAVGPNLLVALLMDGPQLPARWPGKYAGVLADDPGSCVLTVSCQAMVARSNKHRSGQDATFDNSVVALWSEPPPLSTEKVPGGARPTNVVVPGTSDRWQGYGAYPVHLRPDSHAVLLHLTGHRATAFSADGRDDDNATVRFHLQDLWQVRLPAGPAPPPGWASRG